MESALRRPANMRAKKKVMETSLAIQHMVSLSMFMGIMWYCPATSVLLDSENPRKMLGLETMV
jgi:hypothetical protein